MISERSLAAACGAVYAVVAGTEQLQQGEPEGITRPLAVCRGYTVRTAVCFKLVTCHVTSEKRKLKYMRQ